MLKNIKQGAQMPESPIRKKISSYSEIAKKRKQSLSPKHRSADMTPEVAMAVKNFDIVLEYSHSAGFEVIETNFSQFYKRLVYLLIQKIISTGGLEALLFCHGSTMDQGDEIIIPEPFMQITVFNCIWCDCGACNFFDR
jgi:aspartate aminotransferase